MAQIIPNDPTNPRYSLTANLDGVNFVLNFEWNTRASRWYMDVCDASGSPISAGICIVLMQHLLEGVSDSRRPAGDFMAYNPKNPTKEAGLTDLGADVILDYFTAVERGTAV